MTLRIKTLLAGGLTLIALIGALYAIFSRLLLNGFATVERQEATSSVRRASGILDIASARLDESSGAWAQRNESCEFVQTKDAEVRRRYIAKNLNDEILAANKTDIVIYADNAG